MIRGGLVLENGSLTADGDMQKWEALPAIRVLDGESSTFNIQYVQYGQSRLSLNPKIHAPFRVPARLGAGSESVRRGDIPSRAAARRGFAGSALGERGAELVHGRYDDTWFCCGVLPSGV